MVNTREIYKDPELGGGKKWTLYLLREESFCADRGFEGDL